MNISLRIERLILDGLPITPHQSSGVKAAVEAELRRLLQEGGICSGLKSGGAFAGMPPNSIKPIPESSPRIVGQQIAAAVYGVIGESK
jgi:hypothetical protein